MSSVDDRVAKVQAWARWQGCVLASDQIAWDIGEYAQESRKRKLASEPWAMMRPYGAPTHDNVVQAMGKALADALVPDDYLSYLMMGGNAGKYLRGPLHYFLRQLADDPRMIPDSPAFKRHWEADPNELELAQTLTLVRYRHDSLPRAQQSYFRQEWNLGLSRDGYECFGGMVGDEFRFGVSKMRGVAAA